MNEGCNAGSNSKKFKMQGRLYVNKEMTKEEVEGRK